MQHAIAHKSTAPDTNNTDYISLIGQWVARFRTAMTVARERRNLMHLDDRMLKDIGIRRSEAYGEATRPFGDIPVQRTHW